MKPISTMSQVELAAFINSRLSEAGIHVVLSGGAAVAYYSHDRYVSFDIDFVNEFSAPRKSIVTVLEQIGFVEQDRHFVHPNSRWVVEFPPGPLTVGLEPVKEITEVRLDTGTLHIISATDSIKDRLAAFYHWGDRQCLMQAVWIAQAVNVDMTEIRRWSTGEGKTQEFVRFEERVSRQ
jgi:hypothetical protein